MLGLLKLRCAAAAAAEQASAIRVAVDGNDLSLAIAAMIVEKRNVSCE